MSRFVVECPDVKIPSGTAVSNVIESEKIYDDAVAITLQAPGTLDAHTFVLEVDIQSDTAFAANPLWTPVFDFSKAANITLPAAGLAQVYQNPSWKRFRIHDTTGNVAADRIWKMCKEIFIDR